MNRIYRLMGLGMCLAALAIASGCSSFRKTTMPDEDNLLSGAGSLMVKESSGKAEDFEKIDLDKLVESYGLQPLKTQDADLSTDVEKSKYRYRRNELQDRLIAASNQRCGAYIRTLVSSKSQTQMGWGGLATFLSGAATVTTPAAAARVLSAGSTISGSFLSLYNEAYFNNLTVTVISSGIAKKREGLLRDMATKKDYELTKYTVNGAISDALNYHAACNMVTGLEAAGTAINAASPAAIAGKVQ